MNPITKLGAGSEKKMWVMNKLKVQNFKKKKFLQRIQIINYFVLK